ncbi:MULTISPECIES: glycosyltransferase [unclassified Enterococcus]|jgi:glycosyltransferase involved in cell wall biosynthesis|uniref:glycosyltransferase n=1 Tax=unclassified Enterococcus TaxID=2608891 RepID=UPI003D2A8D2E
MMGKLTTSVVMATYNGEKYIIEQLESLKDQTRTLDEVLIYDDRSTDKTAMIIQEFIKTNDLKNWKLEVNQVNQGWRKNFMDLLDAASGDVVFTCDQDDIWYLDKIEKMTECFERNPHISVLVSDYDERIESTGSSAKLRAIKTIAEKEDKRVVFEKENVLLKRPGCVFAIRNSFISKVEEYYDQAEKSAHDIAMWGAALIYDQLYYLPRPTIQFRRHAESSFQKEVSSSKKQTGIYGGRISSLKRFNVRLDSALKFLEAQSAIQDSAAKKRIFEKMMIENDVRIEVLESEKISSILRRSLSYKKTFPYFADFYHIYKLKRARGKRN